MKPQHFAAARFLRHPNLQLKGGMNAVAGGFGGADAAITGGGTNPVTAVTTVAGDETNEDLTPRKVELLHGFHTTGTGTISVHSGGVHATVSARSARWRVVNRGSPFVHLPYTPGIRTYKHCCDDQSHES